MKTGRACGRRLRAVRRPPILEAWTTFHAPGPDGQKALFDFRWFSRGPDLVGLSGGDSMALLHALSALQAYHPGGFSLAAASVHLGFEPHRYEPPASRRIGHSDACWTQDWNRTVLRSVRTEAARRAMCARVRGAVRHAASRCARLALRHNRDDAVETLFMRLTRRAASGALPRDRPSRSGIVQIRPDLCAQPGRILRGKRSARGPVGLSAAGRTTRRRGALRRSRDIRTSVPLFGRCCGTPRRLVAPLTPRFRNRINRGASKDSDRRTSAPPPRSRPVGRP